MEGPFVPLSARNVHVSSGPEASITIVVLTNHLYKREGGGNAGGNRGRSACTQIVWFRVISDTCCYKHPPKLLKLFCVCFAVTQPARQLHQERTQVACSNRKARKRPARRHSRKDLKLWRHTTHKLFFGHFFLALRVEFLLKTESGYLRDAGVT